MYIMEVFLFALFLVLFPFSPLFVLSLDLTSKDNVENEKHFFEIANLNAHPGKQLIAAVCNSGYLELALNWAASLRRTHYTKFLIICLDRELYDSLIKNGLHEHAVLVPPSWIPYATDKNDDVDIVFLSPYILNYIEYVAKNKDFIFSTDLGGYESGDGVNAGYYMVRPTNTSKFVFSVIQDELGVNEPDQTIANRVFRKFDFLSRTHSYALDPLLFPHGLTYIHKRMNHALGITPMMVHACWLGGSERKIAELKKIGMWYI